MEDKPLSNNLSVHVEADRHIQKKRCHFVEQKNADFESQRSPTMKNNEQYTESNQLLGDSIYDQPRRKERSQTFTFTESDCENSRKESVDLIPPVKKRRRYTFISEEEFNRRLSRKAAEWYTLPEGNIYKLEECYTIDVRVVGRMTDEYNNEFSVYLPRFFLDRLLLRNETNIKVFVRRGKGSKDVDIETVEKPTCGNCGRDFSTRNRLKQHIEVCTRVL